MSRSPGRCNTDSNIIWRKKKRREILTGSKTLPPDMGSRNQTVEQTTLRTKEKNTVVEFPYNYQREI